MAIACFSKIAITKDVNTRGSLCEYELQRPHGTEIAEQRHYTVDYNIPAIVLRPSY